MLMVLSVYFRRYAIKSKINDMKYSYSEIIPVRKSSLTKVKFHGVFIPSIGSSDLSRRLD